ncbi:YbaY family lipoprotein [Vibrio hippocampi]|uniref:Lipo-like protein n=1 Tax=Vibrio hippocampi TaxID=654686 RepID=A0ABN8DE48_9VIBR|nr:YbaY family lipoprotein [Vibrio hippocampi]CAH0525298.1 hypothetical protein VHP8226_00904 [Vibrio hippocampi]
MKKRFIPATLLALAAVLSGCEASKESQVTTEQAQMKSVTGTVAYRERIALPPNAVVTIKLLDVSKQDVAADVVAEQTFTTDGAQVPFDFELSYDTTDIQPKHTYSVSARIEVDGKLRFISDTRYAVITDSNNTQHAALMLKGVR